MSELFIPSILISTLIAIYLRWYHKDTLFILVFIIKRSPASHEGCAHFTSALR